MAQIRDNPCAGDEGSGDREVSRQGRTRALILAGTAAIALAVSVITIFTRQDLERSVDATRAAEGMLRARLDMETGFRGFALTRRDEFLVPYTRGTRDYARREARVRALASDSGEMLAGQARLTRAWRESAETAIARIRGGVPDAWERQAGERASLMDGFRVANREFVAVLDERRRESRRDAILLLAVTIVMLGLTGILVGHVLVDVPARQRATMRRRQAELSDNLQLADSEHEAYGLLARHLARSSGARACSVVLNRNNSADRLEAATPIDHGSPLARRLSAAAPRDCLAVRTGTTQKRDPGDERLLECELCGATGGYTLCVPSLIAGEVIGSSLVSKPEPFSEDQCRRVEESVKQAAPVVANLRNLRIAETRAATDVLTGLANNRSSQESLKRLAAIAQRSGRALSVLLLDLDHFKSINDNFGHQVGDDVLAAVGTTLATNVRGSDFVGRYGGEEFILLLPDTDVEGAVRLAEKLRHAIEMLHVPGYTGRVSASFGVAAAPDHGTAPNVLVRRADKALYAAKDAGRNRVHVAAGGDAGEGVVARGQPQGAPAADGPD